MNFTERLALLIDANAKGAIRELEKVGRTSEKELGKATTSVDKWGRRLTIAGTGAVAFAGIAGAGLYKFAKAASDSDLAQAKLDNTLKNSPKLAGASRQAFLDLASAIQKHTVVDDEAVVSSEALLGQFGLTQRQILQLTPLIVDLSRKQGIDLDAATRAVGKAINGNVGTLQRYGIQVDKSKVAVDGFGAVMDTLRGKVGGFAAKEGQTFSGRLAILKNQLGEIEEGVGRGVVDAFSKALGPVTALSEKFASMDAGTQRTIGTIAGVGVAAIGTIGGVSLLAGQMLKLRDRFTVVDEAGNRSLTTLGKWGAGISAALIGLELGAQYAKNLGGAVPDVDRMTAALQSFVTTGKVAGALAEVGGFDKLRGQLKLLESQVNETSGLKGKFQAFTDIIADPFSHQGATEISRARKAFESIDKALEGLVKSGHADEAKKALLAITNGLADAGASDKAISGIGAYLPGYTTALRDAGLKTDDVTTSTGKFKTATDLARDAVEKHRTALRKANDEYAKMFDATTGALGAELNYQDATLNASDAVAELTDHIKKHDLSQGELAHQISSTEQALLGQAQSEVDLALAQDKAAGKTHSAAYYTGIYKEEIRKLAEKMAPGSPMRVYLDQVIARLDAVPRRINVDIDIRQRVTNIGNNPGYYGIPTGPAGSGGAFMPSTVSLGGSAGWRMGGGGGNVVINVANVHTKDAGDFLDQLSVYVRRNGTARVRKALGVG